MGWRFRRGVRIAPGVRLNLGKRSASLSVGRKGFTTNLGRRGLRATLGLPGTGISYTTRPLAARHGRKPGTGAYLLAIFVIAALAYRLLH